MAHALAGRGTTLVLSATSSDALDDLRQELLPHGVETFAVPADLSRAEDVQMLLERVGECPGGVDLLFYAAGRYVRGPVRGLTPADFTEAMDINFRPCVELVLGLLPGMLARGAGAVAAVSSVDGRKGLPLDAPYAASKFALTGFLEVLRQELRPTGIRVVTLLPGRVDTPMIAGLRVPRVSAKIRPGRVARAALRALDRRFGGEVLVPWVGPKLLLTASAFRASLGDALVRMFRLEGETDWLPPSRHMKHERQ